MSRHHPRAIRRHAEQKVQAQRKRVASRVMDTDADSELVTERAIGRLRHGHIGCGCWLCKPHKHTGTLRKPLRFDL